MPDPFYCKLYIDTDSSEKDIERFIALKVDDMKFDITFDFVMYENENFDYSLRSYTPYDFIQSSRYYVETSAIGASQDQIKCFQLGVSEIIKELRRKGNIVTAACDFEDLISEATGWNWTDNTPDPPGR